MRASSLFGLFLATAMLSNQVSADAPAPGSVTANTLILPSGPGSVRGLPSDPSVDPFSGQVRYEVPIETPAFGPSARIALRYSGDRGNGPLGIGWNLTGVEIRRSTRLGVPSYTDADELELVGLPGSDGRLFPIGGGEYRVEALGSLVRVQRSSEGFRVWDANGTVYTLGASAGSRLESGSNVAVWLLEAAVDVAGRAIRYEYLHDQGQVYPAQIVWGPAQQYTVRVHYDQTRPDAVIDYRSGFRIVTRLRVGHIDVHSFGSVLRRYELGYDESFPVSRLAQVVQRGREGQDALAPLTFTYATPVAPQSQKVAGLGSWRLNVLGTSLVDVDGDGASDLLRLDGSAPTLRRNRRGLFGAIETTTGLTGATLDGVQLLDTDGDAFAEVVYAVGEQWLAHRLTGTTWSNLGAVAGTQGLALKDPARLRFADVNGDALVDAIGWNDQGLLIHRGIRGGFAQVVAKPRIGGSLLPDDLGDFREINGDGIADFVVLHESSFQVLYGRGDGTFDAPLVVAYPWTGQYVVARADIRMGDLNRDGVLDLVTAVGGGQVRLFTGIPGLTFKSAVALVSPPLGAGDVVVQLADMNGNGSEDVVWSSSHGVWRLDLAGATSAGMLARVDNGLGKQVVFSYDSSHSLQIKSEQEYRWRDRLPVSIPVVIQEDTLLDSGEPSSVIEYHVWDGFWDALERRFGGFLTSMIRTRGASSAETSEVRTVFHKGLGDKRALRGKSLNVQVRDGAGKLLSITEHSWDAITPPGYPATAELKVPALKRVTTSYLDGATAIGTQVDYAYDAEGRRTHTTDLGRLDLSGDESVQQVKYADDLTRWVRARVYEEITGDGHGAVVSHVRHLFGDELSEAPLGHAGKGWPRRTQAWFAQGQRWVDRITADYDRFGNKTRVTDKGVTRSFTYDEHGLYPRLEELWLGDGSLVWEADWDYVLGVTSARTEPSGHTMHMTYDSLARLTSMRLDDQPAHVHYAYAWTGSFPRTHTYQFDGPSDAIPDFEVSRAGFRHEVEVHNGLGERRYRATERVDGRYIVSGYQEQDLKKRVVFVGDPLESTELLVRGRPAGMVGQTLTYDPLDRVLSHRLADGTGKTYEHRSFEHAVLVEGLSTIRNVLDGQGRIVRTERTAPGQEVEVIEARYDAEDRVTAFSLQGDAVTYGFAYDSLGRLVASHDPDIGARAMTYDDGDRLTEVSNGAGQTVQYGWDVVGRLIERSTQVGGTFRYHYDTLPNEADGGNVETKLAWVEEPTGTVEFRYDALGHVIETRREIDGHSATETRQWSPSGLLRGVGFDDGFSYDIRYDRAARAVSVGDIWAAEQIDAAGRVERERFANGVVQSYARDVVGATRHVTLRDPNQRTLYEVEVGLTPWKGIASIRDLDGVGLDHSADFTYDPFARLTAASLGSGADAYHYSYAYDGLENMVNRKASRGRADAVLAGDYRYGEQGKGPRQLTSIADAAGATVHTFDYDAAGRQVAQDGRTLVYDALDQLLAVRGLSAAGTAEARYSYGYDGLRTKSVGTDGGTEYWFAAGLRERDGMREHLVFLGDRVLASVRRPVQEPSFAGTLAAPPAAPPASKGPLGLLFGLLGIMAFSMPQTLRRPAPGVRALANVTTLALLASCASTAPGIDGLRSALMREERIYFHSCVSAGPVVFTDANGGVVEERRYEPFGASMDAESEAGWSDRANFAELDYNVLNKATDATTGWSYHGARWFAPETARWLTPDPPTKAPDAKFMEQPWALHPYQYVHQNPVAYWDPDGNLAVSIDRTTGNIVWFMTYGDTAATIGALTGIKEADLVKANPWMKNYSHTLFNALTFKPIQMPDTRRTKHVVAVASDVGKQDWAYDRARGVTGAGKNKCTAYVDEKVRDTGIKAPNRPGAGKRSYPNAGLLGDSSKNIARTSVTTTPLMGDTVAWKNDTFTDATGHAAFYMPPELYIYVDGQSLRNGTPDGDWGYLGTNSSTDEIDYRPGPSKAGSGGYQAPTFRVYDGMDKAP